MLYLDKENADKVIGDVNSRIREMEDIADAIDKLITSDLPEYWQGVSAEKAQTTYTEQYKEFLRIKVPEMVDALRDYMQECVKNITEVDNKLAGN